jgi:3-hydroxyacyl-[acyl-carrier-protein] dehydratase
VKSEEGWTGRLELKEIPDSLPHVFPFRMVDRILGIEKGKKATVLKNVSVDEPYFLGHFLKEPVMPGVLILEAMAQTGGIAFHSSFEMEEEGIPVLARIEEFRLKRRVIPGDQIVIEAEVLRIYSNLAKVKVVARVKGESVAEGTLVLAKNPLTPPSPHGGEGKVGTTRNRGEGQQGAG